MHVAHSNIDTAIQRAPTKSKAAKPAAVDPEWLRKLKVKAFNKSVKQREERLEKIRMYFPNWTPVLK